MKSNDLLKFRRSFFNVGASIARPQGLDIIGTQRATDGRPYIFYRTRSVGEGLDPPGIFPTSPAVILWHTASKLVIPSEVEG